MRIKCVDGLDYHKVIFRRDLWNTFKKVFKPYMNTDNGYIMSIDIDYTISAYIIAWSLHDITKQQPIYYRSDIRSEIENQLCIMKTDFCKINIRDEQIEQILN